MSRDSLTLQSLSMITGIPKSTLATYRVGAKASYDVRYLLRLADHFGLSLNQLMFGSVRADGSDTGSDGSSSPVLPFGKCRTN